MLMGIPVSIEATAAASRHLRSFARNGHEQPTSPMMPGLMPVSPIPWVSSVMCSVAMSSALLSTMPSARGQVRSR
jgi:hypothetical protein